MMKLTKYKSFEGLKLHSDAGEVNIENTEKWHLQLEQFLTVLRDRLREKKSSQILR